MGTGLPENRLAVHVYRWNHPCMGVCTCEDAGVCVLVPVCLHLCMYRYMFRRVTECA